MERASRGEVDLPPEAVLDFTKSCEEAVSKQLNKERHYKIRMSGLGRPVCVNNFLRRKAYNKRYNTICYSGFCLVIL